MGMSASQARLLSLTARMHDLEFQAQAIQYSKLDLVDSKSEVYDEYLEALDSTKYQMAVVTADGNKFQDITYTNMIMSNTGGVHSMYIITGPKGEVLLPEQIAAKLGPSPSNQDFKEFPNFDDFMLTVAKNYLYSSRLDITEDNEYISEMKSDGNYDYWKGVYYQIIGYNDEKGTPIAGRGFSPISRENATDRGWLEKALNSGECQLFKMTKETISVDNGKMNIFAETGLGVDQDLAEVSNTELIEMATIEYEKAIKDIDSKETKLDLQLSHIDQQHNALKTEYDAVKQIVSKNIDRSFKSFNA
ncbi:hypothetical protein J6O48_02110 [bacterium]|nr:hypothetical protein [bacterium]